MALKTIAPVIDAATLPSDIASVVADVLADENVQAVAGAHGVLLERSSSLRSVLSTSSDAGQEENKGTASSDTGDEALAQRLQQLQDFNHELLEREKVW